MSLFYKAVLIRAYILSARLDGELARLRDDLLVLVEDTDADDGLAVFQTIVGLDNCRVADASAWHNALHKDIL